MGDVDNSLSLKRRSLEAETGLPDLGENAGLPILFGDEDMSRCSVLSTLFARNFMELKFKKTTVIILLFGTPAFDHSMNCDLCIS